MLALKIALVLLSVGAVASASDRPALPPLADSVEVMLEQERWQTVVGLAERGLETARADEDSNWIAGYSFYLGLANQALANRTPERASYYREEAFRFYQLTRRLRPDFKAVDYNLARLYEEWGYDKQALAALDNEPNAKAQTYLKSESELMRSRILQRTTLSDSAYAAAFMALDTAVVLAPENESVRSEYTELLLRGDAGKAARALGSLLYRSHYYPCYELSRDLLAARSADMVVRTLAMMSLVYSGAELDAYSDLGRTLAALTERTNDQGLGGFDGMIEETRRLVDTAEVRQLDQFSFWSKSTPTMKVGERRINPDSVRAHVAWRAARYWSNKYQWPAARRYYEIAIEATDPNPPIDLLVDYVTLLLTAGDPATADSIIFGTMTESIDHLLQEKGAAYRKHDLYEIHRYHLLLSRVLISTPGRQIAEDGLLSPRYHVHRALAVVEHELIANGSRSVSQLQLDSMALSVAPLISLLTQLDEGSVPSHAIDSVRLYWVALLYQPYPQMARAVLWDLDLSSLAADKNKSLLAEYRAIRSSLPWGCETGRARQRRFAMGIYAVGLHDADLGRFLYLFGRKKVDAVMLNAVSPTHSLTLPGMESRTVRRKESIRGLIAPSLRDLVRMSVAIETGQLSNNDSVYFDWRKSEGQVYCTSEYPDTLLWSSVTIRQPDKSFDLGIELERFIESAVFEDWIEKHQREIRSAFRDGFMHQSLIHELFGFFVETWAKRADVAVLGSFTGRRVFEQRGKWTTDAQEDSTRVVNVWPWFSR